MTTARGAGRFGLLVSVLLSCLFAAGSAAQGGADDRKVPVEIAEIMQGPRYQGATWGLKLIDLQSGQPVTTLGSNDLFFTGSVRKLFSVGLALKALTPEHRFVTPVYGDGEVSGGVLNGDLVLVASGDLTLGGRTTAEGTIAFTNFDHTESNALGSSILTKTDPLAGLDELARQVAVSGVKRIDGEVIVDDRLFDHFRVPNGNVLITPMVVNDNLIDVTILPTEPGKPANVDWRPRTKAFTVKAEVTTVAAGEPKQLELEISPDDPSVGIVKGQIPVGYRPDLPGVPSLVQTFAIEDPSAFARTAFIEALERAGVTVSAEPTGPNRADKLPARGSYSPDSKLSELVSLPYAQYARLILKVSHNLGANLSLMLFGLTKNARTIGSALSAERETLTGVYGLASNGFDFPTNGSGSPDSQATPEAVTKLLAAMRDMKAGQVYFDALPVLGVDGSLATVGKEPPDTVIAPAFGHVYAKTGTTVAKDTLKAQVFAGYIDGKSGARLAYVVYVNNVAPIAGIGDVIEVFGDEGKISAILYERN
ncbi:MAG: D-alanyl-D-alanine carboxypeptidase/D-alanyl-D-alanine-endopeptidase [Methyloceanibacter sp.]